MSFFEPSYYRSKILFKRNHLSSLTLSFLSKKITDNLKRLEEYQKSRIPLIYVSFQNEVHTHQIIMERLAGELAVAIPKTDITNKRLDVYLIHDWRKGLRPGAYGILEPDTKAASIIPPSSIDIAVVPGSVFDRRGGRYGYGGGYFDRFLSLRAPQALRIGLAFSFQFFSKIPLKKHDQKMDIVVTEDEILRCDRKSNQ
jgi:5-formyltetrahydrofolate cyclo-ligase